MKRIAFVATAIALAVLTGPADASNWMRVAELAVAEVGDRPSSVNHQGSIEYGFSPGEGAEKLVLKVIGAARTEPNDDLLADLGAGGQGSDCSPPSGR